MGEHNPLDLCIRDLGIKMKITEDEDDEIELPDDLSISTIGFESFRLVGKILLTRPISIDTLKSSLVRSWHMQGKVECKIVGHNMFVFRFQHQRDMQKVVDGSPWHYDNNLVVFAVYNRDFKWSDYDFGSLAIWVQVEGLPSGCLNDRVAMLVGRKFRRILDVDVDDRGESNGRCLRLRVVIDLQKPLLRGMFFRLMTNGEKKWMDFKYEKLPNFCFRCGILGHRLTECKVDPVYDEEEEEADGKRSEIFQYGSWLRTVTPRKVYSGFVSVHDELKAIPSPSFLKPSLATRIDGEAAFGTCGTIPGVRETPEASGSAAVSNEISVPKISPTTFGAISNPNKDYVSFDWRFVTKSSAVNHGFFDSAYVPANPPTLENYK